MGVSRNVEFPLPHRFYKLHERKCEPIIMTVPRKVRKEGVGWKASKQPSSAQLTQTLLSTHPLSQTCSRMTYTQTRLALSLPWKLMSGYRVRMQNLCSFR